MTLREGTLLVPSGKYYASLERAKLKHYQANKAQYAKNRMDRYNRIKYEACIYRWLNDWNYIIRFNRKTNRPF